jgi:LacI family transcriptional regulator
MANEEVTIKDIAKQLNISFSTVSRALRGHPDVNTETKKKILELAGKLNYEKNPLALSLRKQKTHTIGVIIPEIANTFFSSIISGIQHVAYEAGYNVMICLSDENFEREVSNVQHLVRYRTEGLLVSISTETADFQHFELAKRKLPMVFFDRTWENGGVSQVVVDDYEGAFTMTEHLVEMGYKRIAHLAGPKNVQVTKNRLQGYLDALKKNNHAIDENLIVFGGFSQEFGSEAIKKLVDLAEKPDAVFCVNDRTALGVMLVLKEKHIAIPEEMAVAGFTNAPFSTIIEPNLTTMAQPAFEIGQISTEIMLRHLQEEVYQPEIRTLKTQLLIRDSTLRNKS